MQALGFILTTLAVLTCLACTVLLFRGYARSGLRLLLWSALCFVFFTLNNLLLFFDLQVFQEMDLRLYRLVAAATGLAFLIYGFISESE
jgi:hypothetical protein